MGYGGTPLTSYRFGVASSDSGSDVQRTIYVSDDGQWLVFVSPSDPLGTNPDYGGELFAMSRDGSSIVQLTNDPAPNAGTIKRVAFSGDGTRVAFTTTSDLTGSNPNFQSQLFTVDRSGANLVQQTAISDGSRFFGLDISDDGQRIVFAHDGDLDGTKNDDFTAEIFTFDLSAGVVGPTQITDDPDDAFNSSQVVISGDGTKIAFASEADLCCDNNQNQSEIFSADFDGSSMTQLTKTKNNQGGGDGTSQAPAIVDDGSRVFFHSNHTPSQGSNNDSNFEIYRADSDGTNWTQLTDSSLNDGSFFPVIGATGNKIAFNAFEESFDGTARDPLVLPDMYIMEDADGTNCELNCNIVRVSQSIGGEQLQPSITPDGGKIVFASNADLLGLDPDQGGEIYSINFDGSGLFQITEFDSADDQRAPVISDDGTRIAFISNANPYGLNVDRNPELWIMDADGDASTLSQLTMENDGTEVNEPVMVPDGSRIVYASNSNPVQMNNQLNWEIFSVEPDGTLNTITQITETGVGNSRDPRVDAVGEWIVFRSNADFVGQNAELTREIFRVKSDGTTLEQITDIDGTAHEAVKPDISGDASLIALSSNYDFDGSSNPEENYEVFIYEVGTGTLHQLTTTSRGSSGSVRFSRNGDFLYFVSNAPDLVEFDPDSPFHVVRADLRQGLGGVTMQRIGGYDAGFPFTVHPDADGSQVVFTGQGSFTHDNPDLLDELWVVDFAVGVTDLNPSGKTPTHFSWTQRSGPMRYDLVRGDVSALQASGGTVDLGAVVCIASDVKETSTEPTGRSDDVDPSAGSAFFYALRGDHGANQALNGYGSSSSGLERTPASGDCAPPP